MKPNPKMRDFCLALFSLMMLLYPASSVFSEEVIALVTVKLPPYEEALKGAESTCGCAVKPYFLEGLNESHVLAEVSAQSPKILLAVGAHALEVAKNIKDIPIVYSSVTKPNLVLSGEKNIIGMSMDVPMDQQLSRFLEVAPRIKRIGLIYDPKNSAFEAREAEAAAKARGLELVARAVNDYKEVPGAVDEIKQKIDAFWVAPDKTVTYEQAIEYILSASIEKWIPILIFSERYLKMGATVSLNINQLAMGIEVGKMLKEVMAGTKPQDVTPPGPRSMEVNINTITARKLGLLPDESYIKLVSLIK